MANKTIVQQTFDTPKGVLIFTPKTMPTYKQVCIVDLHWQGYDTSDICFLMNADTDFVDHTIAEYAA